MKIRISALLLGFAFGGCTAKPEPDLRQWRKPDFVIEFEQGSSAFNNAAYLHETLKAPVAILLINVNVEGVALADQRVSSLSRLLTDKEVYVSYLYSDRPADANFVEVFGVADSDNIDTILAAANKYSLAGQSGRLYPEYAVRQLGFEANRKTFAFEGGHDLTATQQLMRLLSDFGWSARSVPVFKRTGAVIPSKNIEMDMVVIDDGLATQAELTSIVETWLDVYGLYSDGYRVAFDRVARKVVVYK